MTMPEFHPAAGAQRADRSLRSALAIRDHAQHCAVLWFADILARQLYRELGFGSMNRYARERLGFSRSRCADFLALARKLDRLPAVRDELASGRLGYTKAREIVTVADGESEGAWLQAARTQSRRQLEQTVRAARARARDRPDQGALLPAPAVPKAALPVRVGFALTTAQHARYEALLGRLGPTGDRGELLLRALAALADAEAPPGAAPGRNNRKTSPRGNPRAATTRPPVQIHVHDCPRCRRATVATPQGERELAPIEREMAWEDAQVHRTGRPNTSTIPPRIRRAVLARDRHTCRRRGCGHTRHLHLHHLTPRAQGGPNAPENLVTLCAGCHRLWHERGGLANMLTAPGPDADHHGRGPPPG